MIVSAEYSYQARRLNQCCHEPDIIAGICAVATNTHSTLVCNQVLVHAVLSMQIPLIRQIH